jgi:hypothetical protein
MKHVLLVALLLTACRRDTVERASPPESPQPEVAKQAEQPPQEQQLPTIEGPKLAFVDEAPRDPALVAYRDELLVAVRKRDADAVIALVDPKIRTSFGGGGGPDDLRRTLEQPDMWSGLEQILTLGGTFIDGSDGKAFWAPYVYSAWPDRHDAFTTYAVIADDVPLVDAPDGKPIAMLSRNIVEHMSDPSGGWTQIKIHDGRSGFVETKHLRSPVGYRAGFNKEGDRWRMTALVAGD